MTAMRSSQTGDGMVAATVSVVTLLVGATTVFAALEGALQQIWGARELAPAGITGWIRRALLSFGLILAVGFLLLVSLSVSTALVGAARLSRAALQRARDAHRRARLRDLARADRRPDRGHLPLPAGEAAGLAADPVGRAGDGLLFQLGRWAISFYLARSTQPSAFGAAASFAALLLWLYYSAQIFLFGAEFTACLGGSRVGGELHGDGREVPT